MLNYQVYFKVLPVIFHLSSIIFTTLKLKHFLWAAFRLVTFSYLRIPFLVYFSFFSILHKSQKHTNRWRTLPHKHPRQVTGVLPPEVSWTNITENLCGSPKWPASTNCFSSNLQPPKTFKRQCNAWRSRPLLGHSRFAWHVELQSDGNPRLPVQQRP